MAENTKGRAKAEKCWFDPANPKKVTQPDAYCDYYTEKE